MNREQKRFDFVVERDGLTAALAFGIQVHKSYRAAVLRSRKRGFPNPHHGSLPEYRRGFIESHLFYKKILFDNNLL